MTTPFVMPLILDHWGYFKNFYYSWLYHCRVDLFPLYLMVRDDEHEEIKHRIGKLALNLISGIFLKSNIIGDRPNMLGCYRAMACKLGVAERLPNVDHYIAIDADVLITRQLTAYSDPSDLINRYRNTSNKNRKHFYVNAENILARLYIHGLYDVSLCPPFIYNIHAACALVDRLRKTHDGDPWSWTKNENRPWSANAPWADPFLYRVFAREPEWMLKARNQRLTTDPLEDLQGPELLNAFEAFDFATVTTPFTVIHSYTKLPPEKIWQKYLKAFPHA